MFKGQCVHIKFGTTKCFLFAIQKKLIYVKYSIFTLIVLIKIKFVRLFTGLNRECFSYNCANALQAARRTYTGSRNTIWQAWNCVHVSKGHKRLYVVNISTRPHKRIIIIKLFMILQSLHICPEYICFDVILLKNDLVFQATACHNNIGGFNSQFSKITVRPISS